MEEKVRALMPVLPVGHRRQQTANTDVFSEAQIYEGQNKSRDKNKSLVWKHIKKKKN